MKIAEFFAEIGFKFDSLKLKEVTKIIGDLNLSSVIAATGVTELGMAIKGVISDTSQASSALRSLSNATGVSTDYIQQLEDLAERYGAARQDADALISSVNKLKYSIATGQGGNFKPFQFMGLDVNTPTETIIRKAGEFLNNQDKLKQYSLQAGRTTQDQKEMAAAFMSDIASALGVSQNMMIALQALPSTDMSKLPILSKTDIAASNAATKEWVTAVQELNVSFAQSLITVTEIGTKLLGWVNDTKIIKTVFDDINAIFQAFDIAGTNLKAWGMNVHSDFQKDKMNEANTWRRIQADLTPHRGASGSWDAGAGDKTIENHWNITVHSADTRDAVHQIRQEIGKLISEADQFQGNQVK